MKNNIYPCLWFDNQGKEAADLYCSTFGKSGISEENQIVLTFQLNGQKFMGLNGGPMFTPNPSISFYVVCQTREEVDRAWNRLSDGGLELMPLGEYEWSDYYGWVQDKFRISWQLALGKMEDVGQKFTPFLMFTNNQKGKAEQAVRFYTSIFDGSSIEGILKYGAGENGNEGMVKHAQFKLGSQVFMATDSSIPHDFGFNEGISLVVDCDDQRQIDYYWDKLTAGGEESMCGWLKDKFGVWWQIVPAILPKLLGDPARAGRVTEAFLKMKKFDIETLIKA